MIDPKEYEIVKPKIQATRHNMMARGVRRFGHAFITFGFSQWPKTAYYTPELCVESAREQYKYADFPVQPVTAFIPHLTTSLRSTVTKTCIVGQGRHDCTLIQKIVI